MFDQETSDRFWSRINKSAGPDGCWFRGSGRTLEKFYGVFYYKNGVYMAHIVAYELMNGPVPEGLLLRHLCGRKGCCNPMHLRPGTQRENSMDIKFHRKYGRGVLAPLRYD
jgi:hypothetical protein